MNITATCPGCGAALSLNENETSTTCPYCHTHFEVNLEQTSPELNKKEPPAEPVSEPIVPAAEDVITPPQPPAGSDFYNPPVSGGPGAAPADFYNPPISGQAQTNPNSLYNPPISSGGQDYTPPPFSQTTTTVRSASRISGRGLWITIAVTTLIVFCVSCLCLLAIVRGIGN